MYEVSKVWRKLYAKNLSLKLLNRETKPWTDNFFWNDSWHSTFSADEVDHGAEGFWLHGNPHVRVQHDTENQRLWAVQRAKPEQGM